MAADGSGIILGSKGGSTSQRTPVEAPDSLNSIASAHFLDLLGEGEFAGFLSDNPLKDVFLDETPVMNADGSLNFTDVFMDWRLGTQDQPYMTGFPSVSNEVAIGVELKQITAWTRTISNTDLSAINVRLSVLALSKTEPTTADINGYSVAYAIDIKTDGGAFVEVIQTAFTGKTNDKYERGHRIDLPPATTDWTVRVRRLTGDTDAANIQDTTMVEAITEIMDLKMRYPNCAYVGLKINAGQFRSIPTRAYRCLGRLMKVPSNYNPVTRVYTGAWDGTFQLAWTRNPAWIFYDLVVQTRFGLGDIVDEDQIDKWALYNIAQYCDEDVPDGKGGVEARFTCTIYLQRQEEAYKIIQDLASVFRGISYWGSGAVIPVADMPRDPVYTYTNANVKDGKFSYQGSAKRARHTVCLVSWSDPEDFNRQKVEYVEDEEGIARYGVQTAQITAIGCTSQGQAQRVGRWLLLTERYETDTVTFAVGLDGALALPGDVIRVADAKRAGRRTGGRVKTATSSVIEVDQIPIVAIADDLICIMPTGVAEIRSITTIVGNVITVSPAFTSAPVLESVWAVESPTLKTQLYSVISLAEGTGLEAIITALQHEPGKFTAADDGTVIEPRPTMDVIDSAQGPPVDVTITASERSNNSTADIVVTASWTRPAGAEVFDVSWRRENGEWSSPQRVFGTQTELFNAFPGLYVCKVTARNGVGVTSIPAISNSYIVPNPLLLPGFVDGLNAAIDNALDIAENAQATADGVIEFFYQNTAPVIGLGVGEAREGDVWVDLDDGNHMWRAFGAVWVDAQDDEIADALAAAIDAQATADGKVKTYFGPTAPVHNPPTVILALGDLWFNTTVGVRKLFRWNLSNWGDIVSDITMDQLAGLGTNLLPDEYSMLDNSVLSEYYKTSFINLTHTTGQKYVGPASLEVLAVAAGQHFYFTPLTGIANIRVTPGKKYIISAYVRCNVASAGAAFYVYDNTTHFGNYNVSAPAVANTWTRVSFLADLTSSTSSLISIRMDTNSGQTWWVDGLMVEYQLGTQTFPSPYSRGTSSGLSLLALARAATAQATADGATVIYRQSAAPTFGPAAIGDYWIDTDDTSYWYSANGSTWTAVTDPRIAQALADAAAAQTTANGRIKTWFQEATPTAATLGDMWYKASVGILYRWDGSLWVNTADNTNAVAMLSVFNPGFEQEFTSWTDVWGAGLTGWSIQSPGLTGAKYMQKYLGVNGTSGIYNDAKFPVQVGQAIVCRVGLIAQSIPINATQGVSIGLAFYNSAGTNIDNTNWAVAPDINASFADGSWRTYNKAVLVPTNASYARVCLLVWGYTGTGIWSFDSVQIFPADEITSGVNLLNNSELANGQNGWTVTSGAIVKEGTNYHWSCTAAGSGVQNYFYNTSPGMANRVTPGEVYSAQIEVKTTGLASPNGSCTLRVQYCNASDVLIEERYNSVTMNHTNQPTEWTRLTLENFKAPTGTVNTYFVFMATGTYTTCRVRKPKFEKGARCTAYTPSVESNWGTEMGTAGSGRRTGDQRNLNQSNVNSYGAVRSTAALTAEHTLGGVKQIHVNAHTAYWGGSSATYNAVSAAITGLTANVRYVVYCDDAGFAGGTKTWLTAATPNEVMQLGDNMYIAGEVTIPAGAGGSSSGGDGGNDFDCVDWNTILPDGRYLRDLIPGVDQVLCVNIATGEEEYVTLKHLGVGFQECSSLIPEHGGGSIVQSNSAPMDLRDGRVAYTLDMMDEEVMVNRDGVKGLERIIDVVPLGKRLVLRPDLGNRMFYGGENRHVTIGTHNVMYKP